MNSDASDPALIGIDWGTSSLRAFLIARDGEVLDRRASGEGILHVPDRDFEAVFDRLVDGWTGQGGLPVLASGMITSRNGWVETPYAALPLDAEGLARALVPHRTTGGTVVHFVTGAAMEDPTGPDVMRGEETQIIGAVAAGMTDGIFVMPGTHSKWITVAGGRIESFATYMTGEVFAALRGHTILGTLMEEGPASDEGFARGLEAGLSTGARLLNALFHVRTLPLTGRIPGTMAADYLSGLLIGAEIAAATQASAATGPVTIIGRSDLTDRYETGLTTAGLSCRRAPDDIAAKGHALIARQAGLLP